MKTTQPHAFHGLEIPVRSFAGARGLRIVHPPGQLIPAHRHDWPLLTLPALGGYEEEWDAGSVAVGGPAVVLHPAGICHANCIHARGMETFSIEFDPSWLGMKPDSVDRSYYWLGGEVSLAARSLVRLWTDRGASETMLRSATAAFLLKGMHERPRAVPSWLALVQDRLSRAERTTATDIAQFLGMHPRWLAHAYRSAAGEGLHETLSRRRVEQAVHLLRSTDLAIAAIAADTGFCDQSHLNRALGRLTGRTPVQIRSERDLLQPLLRAV